MPDSDSIIQPCPSSPNCISSQSDGSQHIEPFLITGEDQSAFRRLKKILEGRADTTIIVADANLIQVEFRTALGFVDDGMFVLDSENGVIHVRSASRLGYWDFGKNRRRIEEIRKEYLKR